MHEIYIKPMFSRKDLDRLFYSAKGAGQNGHMGADYKALREWRHEKKRHAFAMVRNGGGGAKERQRMMRKIERGDVRTGYQGKVLRARFSA